MTKQTILKYLSLNQDNYKKQFGINKLGLFGSYARDEATSKSDIDILIEMNPKSLINRLVLKKELNFWKVYLVILNYHK